MVTTLTEIYVVGRKKYVINYKKLDVMNKHFI